MRLRLALSIMILVGLPIPFWAANPFTPPADIQLFYEIVYPDPNLKPLRYKMYMHNNGKVIALLNNSFVAQGDTFDGQKVIKISDRRVVLLAPNGGKRVVVIDAMQSKLQQLREILSQEHGHDKGGGI